MPGEGRTLMTTSEDEWAALSRDKVNCAAAPFLEPIWEADLEPSAYGYRPQKSADQRQR